MDIILGSAAELMQKFKALPGADLHHGEVLVPGCEATWMVRILHGLVAYPAEGFLRRSLFSL